MTIPIGLYGSHIELLPQIVSTPTNDPDNEEILTDEEDNTLIEGDDYYIVG